MNNRAVRVARSNSWNSLDTQAYRPKRNSVDLAINNTIQHELAKFLCSWAIRKGVSADLMQEFIEGLKGPSFDQICTYVTDYTKRESMSSPEIVTEARFKNGRRGDIYILDTDEIVEIETGKSYEKGEENVITVRL